MLLARCPHRADFFHAPFRIQISFDFAGAEGYG